MKSAIRSVVFILLGLGLLYLAFVNLELDYTKVSQGFLSANYFWILMALIASLASHFIRAIRWNLLFEPLGYKIKPIHSFNAVMIGYLFNFAIPRMGEVSRCGILLKNSNIPVDKSLGTVILERIFDMLILLLLSAFVLIIEFQTLYSFFYDTFFRPLFEKINSLNTIVITIIFACLVAVAFTLFSFRKRILGLSFSKKIQSMLHGFADGFKSVFKLKKPGAFLFQTIAIWFLYFLNTYFYLMAFNATNHIGVAAAVSILVVGTFGFAAPVSGGIGAYHIFVAKGLALYGVSSLAGGVFGFVSHGMQMLMILVVGALSLLYTFITNKG